MQGTLPVTQQILMFAIAVAAFMAGYVAPCPARNQNKNRNQKGNKTKWK
jgi:hypothetical protein